jgi:hypothetical protein
MNGLLCGQKNVVLISLGQKELKRATQLVVWTLLIFFLKKLQKKVGLLPSSKLKISLILSSNKTRNIAHHTLYIVLAPRQNKTFFRALKALLQESKTHIPTSIACQYTPFISSETLQSVILNLNKWFGLILQHQCVIIVHLMAPE